MYRAKKKTLKKRSHNEPETKQSTRATAAESRPKANPAPKPAAVVEQAERVLPHTQEAPTAPVAASRPAATPPLHAHGSSSDLPGSATKSSAELQEVVDFKAQCTAPSVIYDAGRGRIEANPRFARALVGRLARVQGVLLHTLRQAEQAAPGRTPKELLFELERVLLCGIAAAVHAVTPTPDSPRLLMSADDVAAARAGPLVESLFAQRAASPSGVTAVAYLLAEGASHDAVEAFLGLLTARLAEEAAPGVDGRRTPVERDALRATRNNVSDFAQLWNTLRVAYHGIYTVSQRERGVVAPPGLAAGNATSAKLLLDGFYSLLRWVLAVDGDRLALALAATGGESGETGSLLPGLSEAEPPAVQIRDYDPHTGCIELERRASTTRWGLIFDRNGVLVGMENALRNATEAGARLYEALQQSPGAAGMRVLQVNRRRIPTTGAGTAQSMDHLIEVLRGPHTSLRLVVEKRSHVELTAAREVFFEVLPQGGERGTGQQVVLLLTRAATTISWGLTFTPQPSGAPVLSNFADTLQLSRRAKNFLFDHRGQLRVVGLNYREVRRPCEQAELDGYLAESLLLALWLQVDASAARALSAGQKETTRETQGGVMAASSEERLDSGVASSSPAALRAGDWPHAALGNDEDRTERVEEQTKERLPAREVGEMAADATASEPLPRRRGRKKRAEVAELGVSEESPVVEPSSTVEEIVQEDPTAPDKLEGPEHGETEKHNEEETAEVEEERNAFEGDNQEQEEGAREGEAEKDHAEIKGEPEEEHEAEGQATIQPEREELGDEKAPLISNLKTTAEVGMGLTRSTTAAEGEAAAEESTPTTLPLAQLIASPPLTFANDVVAERFDGTELELARPSTTVPWSLKMAFVGDEVWLSRLPPVADPTVASHPFLRALGAASDGSLRCAVEAMNGVDVRLASKMEKARLMETVKKSTRLCMALKVIR